MFLKRKVGKGYSLTMAKDEGCEAEQVLAFVRATIPDADLHSNIGTELSFTLPRDASGDFETFFNRLEANKGDLRVSSYGCSVTALEEVFLKVSKAHDPAAGTGGVLDITPGAADSGDDDDGDDGDGVRLLEGGGAAEQDSAGIRVPNIAQQFLAMFTKRIKNSVRNKFTAAIQLIPPLVCTLATIVLTQSHVPTVGSPARNLSALAQNYGSDYSVWVAGNNSADAAGTFPYSYNPGASSMPSSNVQHIPAGWLAPGPNPSRADTDSDGAVGGGGVHGFLAHAAGGSVQDTYAFNHLDPVALDFTTPQYSVGWFNGEPYHAVAEATNLVDSVILARWTGGAATIAASNAPLPASIDEQIQDNRSPFIGFNVAFSILFGMAPLASSFLLFVVSFLAYLW